MKGSDPCWKGYEMVGMKDKNGKKVPNCVPKTEETELEEEQLDELSNATLTSYKQKAREQSSAADKVGDTEKANKRFSGIIKATKKQFANDIKKEEVEDVKDTSDYKLGKDGRKVRAHRIIFNKGEEDMYSMKEESEQLDEISKKTLGSYIKKASLDAMSQGVHAGAMAQRGEKGDSEKFNNSFNKGSKRLRGIDKASDRLAKEETIDERELTDTEMKERERIVKGLKKKVGDFEAKYGDRAKSVMYATATKLAKESFEILSEAPRGTKHKVQLQYKTEDGYAAKTVVVHAPDKDAAKRYAVSDHQKKGYEDVKALRVSSYKPVSEKVIHQETSTKELVAEEQELVKHKVGVTVSDPNHQSVSMRKEKQQRFIKLSATSKEEALKKAVAHYKKQGYKVHDAFHHSEIKEELVGNQHKLDIDNNGKIDSKDLKKVRKGFMKHITKEQQ